MKATELKKNIFLIENFWTADQCDDYIQRTEALGYEPATIRAW
ncbi:MAG TPA: hypothetical protein VIU12_34340 [Chryseolinea sp.]